VSSPTTGPPVPGEEALSAAMLLRQMEALSEGWRRSAARLDRYAPPAAESFRHAAEDLDRLRARHQQALDALRALRDYLAAGR
jgi:hypothetical protein